MYDYGAADSTSDGPGLGLMWGGDSIAFEDPNQRFNQFNAEIASMEAGNIAIYGDTGSAFSPNYIAPSSGTGGSFDPYAVNHNNETGATTGSVGGQIVSFSGSDGIGGVLDQISGSWTNPGSFAAHSADVGYTPVSTAPVEQQVASGTTDPNNGGREFGGGDDWAPPGLIITRAGVEVNRIGFQNFDSKAKAVVNFVGALENSGIRFDMLPTGTPSNFQEAVEFWLNAAQFSAEKVGVIPNPTNDMSTASSALDRLGNTLGRIGPFEARTVIEYKQLETRPFFIFWTQQTWVPYTRTENVNGPHAGLFLSVGSATDEASRVLVERVKSLSGGSGGPGH